MERDRQGSSQEELAERCFRVPFVGGGHIQLLKQIQELRDAVDEDAHYSVYSTLAQTSCSGKSRTVMELSQLGIYICYCSCASPTSSAYPPRTSVLADKLVKTFDEKGMVLYTKAWLQVLLAAVETGMTAVEWKDLQIQALGRNETATDVRRRWDDLEKAQEAGDYMDVSGDRDLRNEAVLITELEQISDAFDSPSVRVLFVFDEARGLFRDGGGDSAQSQSPFSQIQRAFRVFFSYPSLFGLMLDTAARVSRLMPRKEMEDSDRATKIGTDLLRPIYYLPGVARSSPVPGLDIQEYFKPETWLRYGRPIWSARMDEDTSPLISKTRIKRLLLFARQKLVGAVSSSLTGTQAMALLSATAGLEICPSCHFAETLAASHMNVILRISNDRSKIFVTLPPEPILSEAAASVLSKVEVQKIVFRHLISACEAGYVTGGPRAELVAKIVLLLGVWKLKLANDGYFLQPYKLADFLRILLVSSGDDEETFAELERRLPAGGIVFFNAFLVVEEAPDAVKLKSCFLMGVAIMYQADDNLPGCDAIIPVWTTSGMTCVLVSVKNQKRTSWLEKDSVYKLKSAFTKVQVSPGLEAVTLTISMREPTVSPPVNWLLWDDADNGHIHLFCFGLENNYKFLAPDVKDLLKQLLVTVPDVFRDATDEQIAWIKDMLPLRYH